MSDSVICGRHGETAATFMCRHLAGGVAWGYHNDGEGGETWPDARCDRCDEIVEAAGEWSEEASAEADIKALCTHCYEESRARNTTVPRFARGVAARLTDAETSELLHHAVHEAQAVQATTRERWGWADHARWDYDDRSNTLTLSDSTRPTLVADTQFVGSYAGGTFQWARKTLRRDDPNYGAIVRMRGFGEVRGISKLTTANWPGELVHAWEMASLASYLLGAKVCTARRSAAVSSSGSCCSRTGAS